MNIFAVNQDPITAARELPDKHVTKMILESAQMLSVVFSEHYWGVGTVSKVDGTPFKTEKGAFKKHPCTMWAADSFENCAWLIQHACGLCTEYRYRYGKTHGLTHSVFDTKKLFHRVTGEPITVFRNITGFARAMPDEYKLTIPLMTSLLIKGMSVPNHGVVTNYLRKPDRLPTWLTVAA